jgi:hypothetical protein
MLLVCLLTGFGLFLAGGDEASAMPIFAHRYGFSCQQCHTTVPQLTAFGQYFRANGFRLPGPANGTSPVSVKTQEVYSSAPSTGGPGSLPKLIVDEVELLSAGSLGRNTSYFLEQYVVDGGFPGAPRDMWVQFDRYPNGDRASTGLHARLGQFTLPVPFDPETERPTLQHYAIFDQTVGDNGFNFFDPGLGADFSATNARAGLDAHLVVAESYVRFSGIPKHGLNLMGTVSKSISDDLVAYVYRYQGRTGLEPQIDDYWRQGYALRYIHGKLEATALAQNGNDTSANGLGLSALSSGGFLQGGWHFSSALSLYGRYDQTYDPFNQRQNILTLSLVTRPARNARLTFEGTRGVDGTTQFSTGLMFAY